MPAWRALMDQHACPMVSITGPDGVGMVMMGSPTVLIDYMMACRLGDIVVEIPGLAMGPMNPIIMGCPTVMIGEAGMGGGGGGGGGAAKVVAMSSPADKDSAAASVYGQPGTMKAPTQSGPAASVFAQGSVMTDAADAGTPFCEVCNQ
jgi:hypothetical protein